jgi:hypothetical protein
VLNASELQAIVPVAKLEAIEIHSLIVLVLQKLMKIILIFVLNVLLNVYKIVIQIRLAKELVGQIEMLQINGKNKINNDILFLNNKKNIFTLQFKI